MSQDKISLNEFLVFVETLSINNNKNLFSSFSMLQHVAATSVNSPNVSVTLRNRKYTSSVYSKPNDSLLYLKSKLCHPFHVVKKYN